MPQPAPTFPTGPAPVPTWVYDATVVRVVDGDTVDLAVDVGFCFQFNGRFRLAGINAPEKHGKTLPEGLASRDHLAALLPIGSAVVITSIKAGVAIGTEKFGRWLAMIHTPAGACVNAEMVASGFAAEYWPS